MKKPTVLVLSLGLIICCSSLQSAQETNVTEEATSRNVATPFGRCYECYPKPWLPICCPAKKKEPIDYDPDDIPGDSSRRRLTNTAWDDGWQDRGPRRRQRRPRPDSRPHQRGRPRRPSYSDTPWRSWK